MTCCGKPMQQDGQQLVCGRCGAWIDPGVFVITRGLTN
jgi:hypothetical protein